jgi:hypothetical protein
MQSKSISAALLLTLLAASALGSWAYDRAEDPSPFPLPSVQEQTKNFRGPKAGMMGMGGMRFDHGKQGMPWSTEVSEKTQALFDELRTAQESGDENKITELRDKLKEQFKADRDARKAKMDVALQGGYESWKTFGTEEGIPDAILSKITAENFDKLVELHELRKREEAIEQELGLDEMGMHHMKF